MEKSKPNDLLRDLENQHLRQRSGSVTSGSSLVEFLYLLMRDHTTPGVVEELARITRKDGPNVFKRLAGPLCRGRGPAAARNKTKIILIDIFAAWFYPFVRVPRCPRN